MEEKIFKRFKFRIWDEENKEYVKFTRNIHIDVNGNVFNLHSGRATGYILEQSTGLRDINNIQLYEGDIINDSENVYAIEDIMFAGYLYNQCLLNDESFKIIGNIHKNKELLD